MTSRTQALANRRAARVASRERRALILLVVLGMLTLFSMLAITYVVMSGQARSASFGMNRRDQHQLPGAEVSDLAMKEALRGSRGSMSSIAAHSLLADLYGYNQPPQQFTLQSATFSVPNYGGSGTPASGTAPALYDGRFFLVAFNDTDTTPGLYASRVLTFLSGSLRGQSTRIIRDFVNGGHRFCLLDISDFKDIDVSSIGWTGITGDVLINDRELNGFGLGIPYNFNTINSDLSFTTPWSNSSGPISVKKGLAPGLQSQMPISTPPTDDIDDSYDAPDLNNFWLGFKLPGAANANQVIPSFHRRALIDYLVGRVDDLDNPTVINTASFDADQFLQLLAEVRAAVARPLALDVRDGATQIFLENVGFEGGNPPDAGGSRVPVLEVNLDTWPADAPNFIAWLRWLRDGAWDVDNDLDGISDSIWIDPDLPLATSPEGKLLKVLAAYYIEDMDGRLDVNAVGSLNNTGSTAAGTDTNFSLTLARLPMGDGRGPAETSMEHLFTSGNYDTFLTTRYGSDLVPGLTGDELRSQFDGGGLIGGVDRGANGFRSMFSSQMLPALSRNVSGSWAVEFDLFGNPRQSNGNGLTNNEGTNDPYESWVRSSGAHDALFTLGEWERLYRKNDWDRSSLPSRLEGTELSNDSDHITVRSSHLRVVPMAARFGSPTVPQPVRSMSELIDAIARNRPTAITTINANIFAQCFPMEFDRALPMDLNRPLGNGVDDDNDGSIDEPDESLFDSTTNTHFAGLTTRQRSIASNSSNLLLTGTAISPTFDAATGFEQGNDSGLIDPAFEVIYADASSGSATAAASLQIVRRHYGQQTRQLYARHIYCLAMLVLPQQLTVNNRPTPLIGPERARYLAQWAANVVDFRDSDHAMTRFPYDPEPFDGWDPQIAGQAPGVCNVVWGMEQPELLLQESLAFHDLRLRDTEEDSSAAKTTDTTNPDSNYDQYRIPQGSLFLELYCPRTADAVTSTTTSAVGAASGLYTLNAGRLALDLSKVSPADQAGTSYPVWRMAISEPHTDLTNTDDSALEIYEEVSAQRHEFQYQLDQDSDGVDNSALINGLYYQEFPNRESHAVHLIDRLIWFVPKSAVGTNPERAAVGLPSTLTGAARESRIYFNENATGGLTIHGGDYLVVGPRPTTYMGSKTSSFTTPTMPVHRPSNHRIVLNDRKFGASTTDDWIGVYAHDNTRAGLPTSNVADANFMVAVAEHEAVPAYTVGVNVSEPHPTSSQTSISITRGTATNTETFGAYYDLPTARVNSSNTTPDPLTGAPGFGSRPADGYYDYSTLAGVIPNDPFDAESNTPLEKHWINEANRTNAELGAAPGTQVNWCTAYLQRLADPERPWHATFNPYITVDWIPIDLTVFNGEDNLPASVTNEEYSFASRSKDGSPVGGIGSTTFYTYNTDDLPSDGDTHTESTGVFFKKLLPVENAALPSTPGVGPITYIAATTRPAMDPATSFSTLGYANSRYNIRNLPASNTFVGAPTTDSGGNFTSPIWFNREFASQYEMMYVPTSGPGQMNQEFTIPSPTSVSGAQQYDADNRTNVFGNFLNFFLMPPGGNATTTPEGYSPAALFELTSVSAPWVDSSELVDTAVAESASPTEEQFVLGHLRPPYNRVPNYVEPGRMNVNTIRHDDAFKGLMNNYNSSDNTFMNGFVLNRKGYGADAADMFERSYISSSNRSPSYFASPFKSPFTAGRVPSQGTVDLDRRAFTNPVQATLLRQGNGNRPLFEPRSDLIGSDTNPYREYLPIARLGNLTTTRSNVFAVRVTVGFFEYDPTDGIGPEYGATEGKVTRHRAFYVIDRSIPVAFEPGQDHNTENCVLVRRILE